MVNKPRHRGIISRTRNGRGASIFWYADVSAASWHVSGKRALLHHRSRSHERANSAQYSGRSLSSSEQWLFQYSNSTRRSEKAACRAFLPDMHCSRAVWQVASVNRSSTEGKFMLTLMTQQLAPDVEAVTSLPSRMVWCARVCAETNLRSASWDYHGEVCAVGSTPCSHFGSCQRVARALNRPQREGTDPKAV